MPAHKGSMGLREFVFWALIWYASGFSINFILDLPAIPVYARVLERIIRRELPKAWMPRWFIWVLVTILVLQISIMFWWKIVLRKGWNYFQFNYGRRACRFAFRAWRPSIARIRVSRGALDERVS
jgi:hypothetical protein